MKKKLLIIIGLFAMMPFSAQALTGKVELGCGSYALRPGQTTTCTIKGTSDAVITSVALDINVGSGLTLGEVTAPDVWQGDGNNGKVTLYAAITDNIKGTFDIVTFKVSAPQTLTAGTTVPITLNNVSFGDSSFVGTDIDSVTVSIEKYQIKDITLDENYKLGKYIKCGTKLSEVKSKFIVKNGVKITDANNNEVQDENSVVKTGQKISYQIAQKSYTYTLVVKGDVTGDGKIDINDVSKTYNASRGDITMQRYEHEAGNVAGQQEKDVDINDVSKLYNFFRGEIESLEG